MNAAINTSQPSAVEAVALAIEAIQDRRDERRRKSLRNSRRFSKIDKAVAR